MSFAAVARFLLLFILLVSPDAHANYHSISFNNQADLGKSDSIKSLVFSTLSAGALNKLDQAININGVSLDKIGAQSAFPDQLKKALIDNTANAVLGTAVNGGSLENNLANGLKNAFIDTAAAQTANAIGDLQASNKLDTITHKLAHALAGCVAGVAKANDCSSGALGAVVGEISAELYGNNGGAPLTPDQKNQTIFFARLMSAIAAAVTGKDVNLAMSTGENAATNNYLLHQRPSMLRLSEAEQYAAAQVGCAQHDQAACQLKANLESLSLSRDNMVANICNNDSSGACANAIHTAINNGASIGWTADGKLIVMSPEYSFLVAGSNQQTDTIMNSWDKQQSASLSQSLPVFATVALPEIVTTLGAGKMATGAILGGGFDAAGQYWQLQPDGTYHPGQTAVAAITGAVAYPFSGSSALTDALLGGMTNATNTYVTNSMYGKNDNVMWAAIFGAGFGGIGNMAGNWVQGIMANRLPTNIGATYINPSLPLFQQAIDLGSPNPYPGLFGTGISNTLSATPSFIPLPATNGSAN